MPCTVFVTRSVLRCFSSCVGSFFCLLRMERNYGFTQPVVVVYNGKGMLLSVVVGFCFV